MRRKAKADGGLTAAGLEYLATQRDIWAERRNSGMKLIPKDKGPGYYSIWLGEPGTPDICGLLRHPTGRRSLFFGIETKTPRGKLRVAQKEWHAKAELWGVPVCTARSLRDIIDFVAYLRGMQ